MEQGKLGRRQFLRLSAMAAAGAAVVACQPQTVVVKETVVVQGTPVEVTKVVKETVEVEKQVTTVVEKEVTKVVEKEKVVEVAGVSGRQSPALQEMVKAGTLPPLEERLPIEPQVITQQWNEMPSDTIELQVGQYGGTLRTAHDGPGWDPDCFIMNNEPLLRSPWLTVSDIRGNVALDYKVSSDKQEFTFYLRKGLKWSDGEPVTTEDVRFAIEDVAMNEQINPIFPAWLRTGGDVNGTPLEFEVIDEYTFRVAFDGAYGRFDVQTALTGWRGYTDLVKPKHYLQQFHTNYTPLADLEPKIKEVGLTAGEWWTLFNQMDITNWELTRPDAVGFPCLYPWMQVESNETGFRRDRNPYYFKVDVENMKVLSGEIDFLREDTALKNLPLYKENEQKGNYKVVLLGQHVDPTAMFINLNYPDETWRQVVNDVRFRKALVQGINYEQIIDAVYSGLGEVPFMTPAAYDPDAANQLLDDMGLNARDADGFRLGPDGNTFELPIEVAMHAPDIVPVTEMVVEFWNALGVKTSMKTLEAGLLGERIAANENQASCVWDVEPMWRTGGWTDYKPGTRWAPLWTQWVNTNGAEGEEPPDWVKRIVELSVEMMKVSPATPEDVAIFDELYQIIYDQIPFMPITQNSLYPVIVSAKIGNMPFAGAGIAANHSGEQFYFMA
jgi:peptide/nickel transport system substrate-binding protein